MFFVENLLDKGIPDIKIPEDVADFIRDLEANEIARRIKIPEKIGVPEKNLTIIIPEGAKKIFENRPRSVIIIPKWLMIIAPEDNQIVMPEEIFPKTRQFCYQRMK